MTIYVLGARGNIDAGPGIGDDALSIGSTITYGIMPAMGRPVRIYLSRADLAAVLAVMTLQYPEAVRAAAIAVSRKDPRPAEMDALRSVISGALQIPSSPNAALAQFNRRAGTDKRPRLRGRQTRTQYRRP